MWKVLREGGKEVEFESQAAWSSQQSIVLRARYSHLSPCLEKIQEKSSSWTQSFLAHGRHSVNMGSNPSFDVCCHLWDFWTHFLLNWTQFLLNWTSASLKFTFLKSGGNHVFPSGMWDKGGSVDVQCLISPLAHRVCAVNTLHLIQVRAFVYIRDECPGDRHMYLSQCYFSCCYCLFVFKPSQLQFLHL